MKIYGSISAETMGQHEWITLTDHLDAVSAAIDRIAELEQHNSGLAGSVMKDQETIVVLKAENGTLKLRVEALERPLSDKEWDTSRSWKGGLWRDWVDAVIAVRVAAINAPPKATP